MKYKLFLLTAVLAVACTQTETIEPAAVAKGGGDTSPAECDYRSVIEAIDTTTTCDGFKASIEPCVKLLCKQELAAVVDYADAHSLANSFGPCDWSWLPEGTPCE